MTTRIMGAALLGMLTAGASPAVATHAGAPDVAPFGDEGGIGSKGVRVASAVASPFLFTSAGRQSSLTPVAEGGEGGEGRRGRRVRNQRRDVERLRAQEIRRYRQQQEYGRYQYQMRQRGYDPYYDRPRARDPYYDQRSFGPRF